MLLWLCLKWNIKIRWFTPTRWACIISCFMWDFPRRKLTRIPDTNLIPMMTFKDIHFPNFSTNLWRMELAPFNPSSNLLFLVKDNKRAMLDQISSIKIDQDQMGGDSLAAASVSWWNLSILCLNVLSTSLTISKEVKIQHLDPQISTLTYHAKIKSDWLRSCF